MPLHVRGRVNRRMAFATIFGDDDSVAQLMPKNTEALLDLYYDVGTWQDTGATTPATTSDNVARWDNQGIAATNALQSNASFRPQLTANGIDFVATSSERMDLTGLTNSADDYTIGFRFTQKTFSGVQEYLLDVGTGRLIIHNQLLADGNVGFYADGAFRQSSDDGITGDQLIIWRLSAAAQSIRRNAAELTGFSFAYVQTAIGGGIGMATRLDSTSNYANVTIKHCFIIPRYLTNKEVGAIESWSQARFGAWS